jgi:alpha-tubulin suppressor-like RCC1 family protein
MSSFLIKENGKVMSLGQNPYGHLAHGNTTTTQTPTTISGLTNIVQVSNTGSNSLFLKSDGTVYGAGRNQNYELGLGNTTQKTSATLISGLSDVIQVSIKYDHSLFLLKDGTVKSCGKNDSKQTGHSSGATINTPTAISGLSGVVQVVAGISYSLFLINDGTVKAIGSISQGQFGDGADSRAYTSLTALSGVSNVKTISSSGYHTLILLNDGTVKSSGLNDQGQLGKGNTTNINSFSAISSFSGVANISTSNSISLFLKTNGTLFACGDGAYGSLGVGDTSDRTTPTSSAFTNVISYYCSSTMTVAVDKDGVVKYSGNNGDGLSLLGNNNTGNNKTTATVVSNATTTNIWNFNSDIQRLKGDKFYKHLDDSTSLSAGDYPTKFIFISNNLIGTYAVASKTVQTMTTEGSFYAYSNVIRIGGGGTGGGDPYIYPLFGTHYKLPNVEKSLRLLDNCDTESRFFLNAKTKKVGKEEADYIEDYVKELCRPYNYDGLENIGLKDGTFFSSIYIENINNGFKEYVSFNLDNCSYDTNILDFDENIEITETKEEIIKLYLNEDKRQISFRFKNEINGFIDIIISMYKNPQIKNSIQFFVDKNIDSFNGLFSFYKETDKYYLNNLSDSKSFNYSWNKLECRENYNFSIENFNKGNNVYITNV